MIDVSVIMAVKNNKINYLEQSIESILNQTLKNFEFIIIADGSNIETLKILNYYEKKDSRIILVTQKINKGLAYSLNIAIKKSKSKYLVRQDYDDISIPERLAVLLKFFKKRNLAVCGSSVYKINYKNSIIGKLQRKLSVNNHKKKLEFLNTLSHSSVIMNKEIIIKIGLYNEKLECSQDYDLWQRVVAFYNIASVPEYLVKLRIHESSVSSILEKQQRHYSFYIGLKHRFPKYTETIEKYINVEPIFFLSKISHINDSNFINYINARLYVFLYDKINLFRFFRFNLKIIYNIVRIYFNRPTYLVRRLINF